MVISYEMYQTCLRVYHYDISKQLVFTFKVDIILEKCIVVTDMVMMLLVPAKVLIHVWS